jgi:hypothetical protein
MLLKTDCHSAAFDRTQSLWKICVQHPQNLVSVAHWKLTQIPFHPNSRNNSYAHGLET